MFVNLCCMYSGATLDAYLFTAVISSRWFDPLPLCNVLCLSHTVFVLKSILLIQVLLPQISFYFHLYWIPFFHWVYFLFTIWGLSWHLFFFLCISNCSWTVYWTRYFFHHWIFQFHQNSIEYIYGSISVNWSVLIFIIICYQLLYICLFNIV